MTSSGLSSYARVVARKIEIGYLARPRDLEEANRKLKIFVVFTSESATVSALKQAAKLAANLPVNITLVVPQIVPYPLPVEEPPVRTEFNERRFRMLAGRSPVHTSVRICLCRDRLSALVSVLSPKSIVVIGRRRGLLPTAEGRLARDLRRAGHEVIVVKPE